MKKIENISSILSQILKDYDREIWACTEIMKNWNKIGGKSKLKNISLKNGVLKIISYDSAFRNFVSIAKPKIINKINQEILKEDIVKDIQVFGSEIPIYKRFSKKPKK